MSQPKEKGNKKRRGSNKINIGDKGREIVENITEDSLVLQQFEAYSAELDERYDRFERIVRIGRDINNESKKIIFLLHTIDKKSKQESVLHEAGTRLRGVAQNLFGTIARELENQDAYQFYRAYSRSLEEYVEAVTFYQYLYCGTMESWVELEKMFTYTITDESEEKTLHALITPYEFILGVADLTGELMRKCINNLATGDIAGCYQTCNFVRDIHTGFLGCAIPSNRGLSRKLCVLSESLEKMENVCYTIKVRGSEIPQHILVDVAIEEYPESDESYQVY